MLNHNFKKKFGQNFLSDKNLLAAIVQDAGVGKNDDVLEIGAGGGNLTEILSQNARKVVSYEVDKDLQEHLMSLGLKNTTFKFADIMKCEIQEIENDFQGKYRVVANLPYYITTPIIFKFLTRSSKVCSLTIMVQKEVARRLTASPGSSDYGSFTVFVNYFCTAEKLFDVPRGCFRPIPGVDSSVVKLLRRDEPVVHPSDEPTFFKVIAAAFGQRRKTLVNSLGAVFDKKIALEALTASGIAPNTRGEQLSIVQFFQIGEHLFKLLQPSLTAKRL